MHKVSRVTASGPSKKQAAIKQRKGVIPIVVVLCSTLLPMMIRLHATTCLAVNEICTNARISMGLRTMEHICRRLRLDHRKFPVRNGRESSVDDVGTS